MILKIMGEQNMPDDSVSKPCHVIDCVVAVNYFKNIDDLMVLEYTTLHGNTSKAMLVVLAGNAYLMNDAGKTIQSFSAIAGQEQS